MTITKINKVLMMAAGTGGHIFPGLAIARTLAERGIEVVWLGTPQGMENHLVDTSEFKMERINISGMRGKGLLKLVIMPYIIVQSMIQSFRIIQRIKPDLLIGMGGYVSGPAGVTGRLKAIPLVIHEQNAIAGLSNKVLNLIASRTLYAFSGAEKNFIRKASSYMTGNPVRSEIVALYQNKVSESDTNSLKILVIGGSLGAQKINQSILDLAGQLDQLKSEKHYRYYHIRLQCGQNKYLSIKKEMQSFKIAPNTELELIPFIDDMAKAYGWADLAICRAGALTISELSLAQLPAILIPYPYAVDDHQTANARYLSSADAAILIPQKQLTAQKLLTVISELIPQKLMQMQEKLKTLAVPDATNKVIDHCLRCVEVTA